MADKLKWERLAHDKGAIRTEWQDTYRAKVPGGWLVAIWATVDRDWTGDRKGSPATPSAETVAASKGIPNGFWGGGLTFMPDARHKWKPALYKSPKSQK